MSFELVFRAFRQSGKYVAQKFLLVFIKLDAHLWVNCLLASWNSDSDSYTGSKLAIASACASCGSLTIAAACALVMTIPLDISLSSLSIRFLKSGLTPVRIERPPSPNSNPLSIISDNHLPGSCHSAVRRP